MTKYFLIILTVILAYSCSNNKEKIRFNHEAIELDNKAAILISKGEYDSALRLLDKALEIDSTYYPAYGQKATIYIAKNLPDSAITLLNKEIELKPDFAEVWTNTGILYDSQGDSLKAKVYYEKSIRLYDIRIATQKQTEKKDSKRANRLNRAFSLILAGHEQNGRQEALKLKHEEPNNLDTIIINGLLTKTRLEILNEYSKK